MWLRDAYNYGDFSVEFSYAESNLRPVPGDVIGLDFEGDRMVPKMIIPNVPNVKDQHQTDDEHPEDEYYPAEV